MIFPVLAGLGALAACMSNPRRKRRKARRRNPQINSLAEFEKHLWKHNGKTVAMSSTDVGGYPMFYITADGGILSPKTVTKEMKRIKAAIKAGPRTGNDQWRVVGVDVNWEDASLHDDHTGERIPSAYAEDDAKDNPKRKGRAHRIAPGAAAARLAKWRWHHNPRSNPRTTVKRYCGQLVISLGVDDNKSMPPRASYFGRVSGSGVDYPFNDLSILLPPHSGIDAPASFDKAAEAILHFAYNDVGDEVIGLAEDDPATAERETTFVIQRKKNGTKFYPARSNNPRRKRRRK